MFCSDKGERLRLSAKGVTALVVAGDVAAVEAERAAAATALVDAAAAAAAPGEPACSTVNTSVLPWSSAR